MGEWEMRVTIGTRGSKLARAQTEFIVARLQKHLPEGTFSVRIVQTEGDRQGGRPVSEIGDKGIFIRAIEQALITGDVDLAVHSLKDVPAEPETAGLELAGFAGREDPRDVLVSASGVSLDQLPRAARIGTGSLRRRVQLKAARADLVVVDIRGNVDTRLRRLDAGEYDAIVLAAAGLHRLGLARRVTEYFALERFIPDAGQGILALQIREGDARLRSLAMAVEDREARLCALAERATVRALGADCRSPVGAYAWLDGDRIQVIGMAAPGAHGPVSRAEHAGNASDPEQMGQELGEKLVRAMSC
jgi:hydroxymethylbilane synthase